VQRDYRGKLHPKRAKKRDGLAWPSAATARIAGQETAGRGDILPELQVSGGTASLGNVERGGIIVGDENDHERCWRNREVTDKRHTYSVRIEWIGNQGPGTASYRGYSRAHDINVPGKPTIPGSSDPAFRGDAGRWNPEELLVASLSACHQLWYLHLCVEAGVVVQAYRDDAVGVMIELPDGAGQFESVTLRPHATLAPGADEATARRLHDAAAQMCFIARSVSFRVKHEPSFEAGRS
jgi:organic hydroperoxide reductase OsmC/OhrA